MRSRDRRAEESSRLAQGVLLALLTVPLWSWPGSGPNGVRLPLAAALVTLLSIVVAWSAARRGEGGLRGDPTRIAMVAWLVASLLSLLAAEDLWSAFPPLAVLGLGIATYLAMTSGSVSREFAVNVGAIAISLVGIAVAACILGQRAMERIPAGPLGNSNLSGAAVAMLFPFSLCGVLGKRHRIVHGVAAVCTLVAVVVTGARGALLGLLAGGAVAGGAWAWSRWGRRGAIVAILAAVVGLGVSVPLMIGRSETVRIRWGLWKGSLGLFLGHPIVGCGIGNFHAQFPPYRTAEEFRLSNPKPGEVFVEAESAHSTWLQLLAETGVPGLLAFLLVVYVSARLWRYYVKSQEDPEARAVTAGSGGSAAAFLVSGCWYTLHTEPAHVVLFFLMLGLSELTGPSRARVRKAPATQARLAAFGAVAILGVFVTILTITRSAGQRLFLLAMREPDAERRGALLRDAVEANHRDWRSHFELARTYEALGHPAEAAVHFRRVLEVRPHQVAALNGLAVARLRSADGRPEAEGLLERASRVAPYYYKSYFHRGISRAEAGDFPASRAMFGESIRCHPTHAPSYLYRGLAAFRQRDFPAALDDFRNARRLDPALVAELKDDIRRESFFAELFR